MFCNGGISPLLSSLDINQKSGRIKITLAKLQLKYGQS